MQARETDRLSKDTGKVSSVDWQKPGRAQIRRGDSIEDGESAGQARAGFVFKVFQSVLEFGRPCWLLYHQRMKTLFSRRFPPLTLACLWAAVFSLFPARGRGAEAPTSTNRFEKDILAFEAADRKSPPPQKAILFAGDSQFTRWKSIHEDLPGYTVINRGFGGSQMSDLLEFTDRIVIPYKPRLIVVNEGGNDIHVGRTPEALLADIKTFVNKVRAALPATRIAISGLAPSPARLSESDVRKRFNEMLKAYIASQKDVMYIDLFDAYLGPDGKPREELFVEDRLHHSAAGYQVRMRIMQPVLGEPDRKK